MNKPQLSKELKKATDSFIGKTVSDNIVSVVTTQIRIAVNQLSREYPISIDCIDFVKCDNITNPHQD